MKNLIMITMAIVIMCMLVPAQYVRAISYDEVTQEVNFTAIGGADESQNNLDDGAQTNYDTWDPVPQGVWFGGWPVESRLRVDDVPDTNFEIALATVCQFGPDIIMSGAARTLVRLPIMTSDDPWLKARLNVYEVAQGTNWTFTQENATAQTFGVELGKMRVNFTSGSHRLIFWSEDYDPTDLSPTDGNDHFTRSNRTYAFVDAPLKPSTYYLFITYVWYASDKYVETFIQPDSLDSEGNWNRSSIAIYNEQAPDTYTLEINNFNISCGYSFDFRNGFGNGAYGLNIWVDSGDELGFFIYVDPLTIDSNNYLTFMLPYRSTTDNLSIDVALQEYNPITGGVVEFASYANYICRDFILLSLSQTWGACVTAFSLVESGWFRVAIDINNDTRFWVPLWDIGPAPVGARVNRSWGGTIPGDIWDSDNDPTYNFAQMIQVENSAGDYNYHWAPQGSIQFNNYRWDRTVPPTTGTEKTDQTENMSLTSKIVYGVGGFFISVGDFLSPISVPFATAFRAAGTSAQMIAKLNVIPDWAGKIWDGIMRITEFFQGIGQWIWRAAQSAVGFIRWAVETITYFASIILGLLVFVFAVVFLMMILWFAAKFGQIIVLALRGRFDQSVAEMANVANTAKMIIPRRRG
jgi:hypothetical protein